MPRFCWATVSLILVEILTVGYANANKEYWWMDDQAVFSPNSGGGYNGGNNFQGQPSNNGNNQNTGRWPQQSAQPLPVNNGNNYPNNNNFAQNPPPQNQQRPNVQHQQTNTIGGGSCPNIANLPPVEQCAGSTSNCWSVGQPDVDCPGNALCCFDGCSNTCQGAGGAAPRRHSGR